MAINLCHGDTTIYSSATPSNKILVGTREGVITVEREAGTSAWRIAHRAIADKHISADGGKSWEILKNGRPDRLQASIEAFCLEEAGSATAIYAATTAGEVISSDDLGDSWQVIVKGLPPISKAGHFRALVQAA